MKREIGQEGLSQEVKLKEDIHEAAAEDLAKIVETRAHLSWENLEASWGEIYGRVFEALAKHDPSVPRNEENNLQKLNGLVLGLMEIAWGWVYKRKPGRANIPDRFLFSYLSEAEQAIITGIVEIKLNPEALKLHKSKEFREDPLKPLKNPFERINQFLQTSAKGYLINPPVKKIILNPPEKTQLYLVVPRRAAETGAIRFTRWEIVESIFTVEEVESITQRLFATQT